MPHIQILNIHGPHTQAVHTLPCQSQQDAPSLRALHWPHENLFSLFLPMFYNDFLLTFLTQLCKVSSPCLSTFIESLLCTWQCARNWLGAGRHNGEQNIVILHSGRTSSAPTFCPNFLSGFQILLESSDLSPFFTLIFTDRKMNSKHVLLICHSCQMIPSSTTLRQRQKGPLP